MKFCVNINSSGTLNCLAFYKQQYDITAE